MRYLIRLPVYRAWNGDLNMIPKVLIEWRGILRNFNDTRCVKALKNGNKFKRNFKVVHKGKRLPGRESRELTNLLQNRLEKFVLDRVDNDTLKNL